MMPRWVARQGRCENPMPRFPFRLPPGAAVTTAGPVPVRLAALVAVLVLAGCATTDAGYRAPAGEVPARWQATAGASGPAAPERGVALPEAGALADWWRRFDDPLLDGLVAEALERNLDLRTARARLQEARAAQRQAAAGLWPSLSAGAAVGRSRGSGGGGVRDSYRAELDASWEVDLFGRLRSARMAALAGEAATREEARDTQVVLVAEVARLYIELRTAQRRLALAEATLQAREEVLALAGWRQQAGLVAELDVAQARTEAAATRAGLPPLRTAAAEAQHRLAVLLALPPAALAARLAAPAEVPVAAGDIAVGIPADTLRQRPDVRAAERRLAAQVARLDEARAARYPSLRLSGSIGWEAFTLAGLGEGGSLAHALLAGLSLPLFDGGRLRAAVDVQDARLEQSRLAYEAAVLAALEEVESALVALAHARERAQLLAQAVASAQATRAIADYRYRAGLADFLSVLDSERTLLSLQDQLAQASGALAFGQVRLYKALGGGWSPVGAVPAALAAEESR